MMKHRFDINKIEDATATLDQLNDLVETLDIILQRSIRLTADCDSVGKIGQQLSDRDLLAVAYQLTQDRGKIATLLDVLGNTSRGVYQQIQKQIKNYYRSDSRDTEGAY